MENKENEVKKVEEEEIIFHDEKPAEVVVAKGNNNTLAITSLVCAILSIVTGVIPAESTILVFVYFASMVAGVILGIIALGQIKKNNQSGKIFAILGIVGSILSFIIMLVVGVIQIANMPEEEFNDMIYCPYVTDCVKKDDDTSVCLYVDDSEVTCSNEVLTEEQFKENE